MRIKIKRNLFVITCVLSIATVTSVVVSAKEADSANVKEPPDIVVVNETREAEIETVNIIASDVDDVKSEVPFVSTSDKKNAPNYLGEYEVGDIAPAETEAETAEHPFVKSNRFVNNYISEPAAKHVRTHPITGETKEQD